MQPDSLSESAAPTDAARDPALAEADLAVPTNRRSASRKIVRLPLRYRYARVRGARWNHGIVLNLSDTGGCFLVDDAWQHAARVDGSDGFRIELEIGDGRGGWVHLAGGVVWVRPDGGGGEGIDRVGVRFTDVADGEGERLRRLLAH